MKSFYIPKHITLTLFNAKDKKVIQIKNHNNSFWFLIHPQTIYFEGRTIKANPIIIRNIKKILKNLEIGHIRTLTLGGIGYKAFYSEENGKRYLDIKTSTTNRFLIPNDISLRINKQQIQCWSYHPTLIDHFFKKIIAKTNFTTWH